MPDVLLLGAAVGYSRIAARIPVHIGWGGICLILAAVCAMLCRATLDRSSVWSTLKSEQELPAVGEAAISCTVCDLAITARAEHERCPRCAATVYARKPSTFIRTLALVIAGFALYIPANLYPRFLAARRIDLLHEDCHSTIEALGLSWFLVSIRCRSTKALVVKTKLYRVIDEIGRWSNVDVLTLAIFVPMIQFGGLATASAGIGGAAFILVVMLTMVASRIFDPRLLLDAAQAAQPS